MKMTAKRLFAFFLATTMIYMTSGVVGYAESAELPPDYGHAEVHLADPGSNKNVHEVKLFGSGGTPKYEVIGGRTWLVLDTGQGEGVNTIGIDLNDRQFTPRKMHTLQVSVTYLDKGRGFFPLQAFLDSEEWYTDPVKAQMTDSGQVKTHTWVVTVMSTNRYNWGDVGIGGYTKDFGYTPANVYISDITVDLLCPQKPLYSKVETGASGNILEYDEQKKFSITVENTISVDVNGKIGYEIRNEFDNVLKAGELGEVNLAPAEAQTFEVEYEGNKFGVYTLNLLYDTHLDWLGKAENKVYEQPVDFSIINGFEPGQKKNKKLKAMLEVINERFKAEEKWEGVKDALVKSGLGGIRDEIRWEEVELEKGKFTEHKLEWLWKDLEQKDLENMATVIGASRYWVDPSYTLPKTPEEIQAMGKYVEYSVNRFGDHVEYIEVYNEENVDSTAGEYVNVLKEAYTAVKKVNPQIKVAGLVTSMVPLNYIEECFRLGALDYMDAVSVHPYAWGSAWFRDQDYIDKMVGLRELCVRYGKPDVEIIASEVAPCFSISNDGTALSSQHNQAAEAVQIYATTEAYNLSDEVYYYNFVNKSSILADFDQNFGMIKHISAETPFAAKPVYVATVAYNQLLADAEFKESIEYDKTRITKFKRNADGKDVIVLWTDEAGTDNLRLNLGASQVEVIDMYGNSLGVRSEASGCYDFMSCYDPIYVVGNFTKFEKATPDISVENGRIYLSTADTGLIKIHDSKKRNLRVDVQASANIEVAGVKNVENGYGEIAVVTNEKSILQQPVDIALYDGSKLVYTTRAFTEQRLSPIEVSVESGVYSENLSDLGKISVNIKNMNFGDTVSGTITSDFSVVDGGIQTRRIVKIQPGKTQTYEFYVPRSSVVRSIAPVFEIVLDNGYSTTVSCRAMTNYISKYNKGGNTVKEPYLFGAASEAATRLFPDWGGVKDASFVGSATWDEENLYVHLYGYDDVFYQPETDGSLIWRADSFQVSLENLTTRGRLAEGRVAFEFSVGLTPEGPLLYRTLVQQGSGLSTGKIENGTVEVDIKDGMMSYKVSIPWTEVFGKDANIEEGQVLGFAALYNDSDGVKITPSDYRRGSLEFCRGISTRKEAELFGRMVLVK